MKSPWTSRVWKIVLLGGWLLGPMGTSASWAQTGAAAAAPEAPPGPADEYGRGVPRSTMAGFLAASADGDFERAAKYLDLRRIPESRRAEAGPELARKLDVVLDRSLWVEIDSLSDQPQGDEGDGLPGYRDAVGSIESASGTTPVYLDHVLRGDGVRIWKVSGSTLAEIPRLYEEFRVGLVEEHLPAVLTDVRVLDLALWQWIAVILLIVLSFFGSWLAALAILRLSRPLVRSSGTDMDDHILDATIGPLRLTLAIGVFHVAKLPLGLPLQARAVLDGLEQAFLVLTITWLLFRLIDVFGSYFEERLQRVGQPAAQFVPLGRKSLKFLIGILAGLYAADAVLGQDVTTLLAGLGVGGLAVALAAQKTIENFFGGVFLYADRPVAPGDFCRFGDQVGTVEDIGLRSTRIRTLDRTLVTVPNAEFSSLHLENFAARDRIRFTTVLGLRYETSADQLRHVLMAIRRLLLSHPRVDPDPARVRFVAFGAYSLDLEIFAYVRTSDWNEFVAIREDLLLRLMDVVEESGSGFAFPSQTSYLARDEGIDSDKARQAAEEVSRLRQNQELALPDYPEATRSALAGSLAYPEEGSVLAKE